jgi:hypothetical protein
MTNKWIAINLLLLLTAGLLAWQLRESVLRFKAENDLAKIQPARDLKQKIVEDAVIPPLTPGKAYNPAEFAVIPEKNVFSETRSREDKTESQAGMEIPPLAQKPILVGISISENQKLASVIDPLSAAQNQSRRAQTKRIGDVYQGYTITDITAEHIVLDSGLRKEIIPLHQGSKRLQGGKTAILATRVVPIGGGAAGGTAPVAVVSGGMSAARTTAGPAAAPAPAAAVQPGAARVPTSQVRQTPGGAQTIVVPSTPQQPQMQVPSPAGAPGTRTIRTPFGDIIRPNP